MTPDQLAKSGSEHGHQAALFAYCAVARIHGFDAADTWAETGQLSPHLVRDEDAKVQALEWLHAIHNQGHGDAVRGARAKAEGVKKGIADLFLPWPIRGAQIVEARGINERGMTFPPVIWCGLYIEMKKPSEKPKKEGKGGVSDEQAKFGEYAKRVGFGWAVCYSWREAADTLRSYIEWKG